MSKIGAIERWKAWAGSLANRHRRLGARTAGLSTVLARTRAAGCTVREQWLLSSRALQPRIHLSIQPLLRFDLRPAAAAPQHLHQINLSNQVFERFDLRPAAAAPQVLREVFHEVFHRTEHGSSESHRTVERFRQTGSFTTRVVESPPPRLISQAPRIAPLALVMQRLREPAVQAERRAQEGPASRPALARHLASHLTRKVHRQERSVDTPAVRVLREDAQAPQRDRSDRAFSAADRERTAAPEPWRAMSAFSASTTAPGAMPAVPPASVEAITENVMHQIDQRLHAWRERRGGF